jgi:hypothetical protein
MEPHDKLGYPLKIHPLPREITSLTILPNKSRRDMGIEDLPIVNLW